MLTSAPVQGRRGFGWSRWLAGMGLLLAGLLLPLMFMEGLLRWFGPILPGRYSAGLHQEPHPELGRQQVPSTSGWYRSDEFVSRVRFNALGLREREIPLPKQAGERRILVLGDSFVQGVEVDESDLLTRRLEQRLIDSGHPALVINAGVAGYSTDQQLTQLRTTGWQLQPDLVVLVFYLGNDVTENSEQLTRFQKPYYTLDDAGELRPREFRYQPRGMEPTAWLRRESRLFAMLDTGIFPKLRTFPGFGRFFLADLEVSGPVPLGAGPGGSDVYRASPSEPWVQAWDLTGALIQKLASECHERGIPVMLVAAPTKWEIYPDEWDALLALNRLPTEGWDLNSPGERLREIAERGQIPYVSTRAALQAAAAGLRLYFRHDVHWTPAGHQVVAGVLAESLLAPNMLASWDPS